MIVRSLRAILAKLPDDATVMVSLNGTRINVEKAAYSHSLNQAALFTDGTEVKVALDAFIQKEIDFL